MSSGARFPERLVGVPRTELLGIELPLAREIIVVYGSRFLTGAVERFRRMT